MAGGRRERDRALTGAVGGEVGRSPATLIQRSGTPHQLLAADRRGVELWVTSGEEAEHPAPLDRVVGGLVGAADPGRTPDATADSAGMLQLDLVEPDFHDAAERGGCARPSLHRHLLTAADAGELRDGIDTAAFATLVETTHHGTMTGWALHREGSGESEGHIHIHLTPSFSCSRIRNSIILRRIGWGGGRS